MMGKYPRVVSGLTAIPSASWHDFVEACLSESGAEVTGECTDWASGNDYGTMPNWDTSLVEDMSGLTGLAFQGFGGKSTFNGDISKWNTAKVTDMYYMFYDASAFNHNIGSWNTEKVTDMSQMFGFASAFNHDISSWTGSAATTAQTDMFLDATAFQAKFSCDDAITGPASSCDTIKSDWVAPSPPPSPPSPPPSPSPPPPPPSPPSSASAVFLAFLAFWRTRATNRRAAAAGKNEKNEKEEKRFADEAAVSV
jgi:surface protein